MSFGAVIFARLAEAAAAGHDGFVVVFPEPLEVRIAGWVAADCSQPPQADLALRVVPADDEWRIPTAGVSAD